jgi:gluconolactonase
MTSLTTLLSTLVLAMPITTPDSGTIAPQEEGTAAPQAPAAAWPKKDGAAGEDIPGVVAKGTPIYKWSDGHAFTEGPACAPDGTMYFTDIPNNQILRLDPAGAQIVVKDARGPFGLFFAKDGTLYCTQGADQRIAAYDLSKCADGACESKVICDARAEPSEGTAGALGKVNDLVLDRTGGLWFTAPVIGRKKAGNAPDAVYYCPAEGGKAVEVVRTDKVVAPNGIHLSPDSKTLYVVPYLSLEIMAYPIEGPGKLGEGKVFYKIPGGTRESIGGDGLTVDTRGNVYVAVPARAAVFVLSPEGEPLGMIRFPERPSNCALGGKDGRTLFVTAQKGVYAIDVEGARSR